MLDKIKMYAFLFVTPCFVVFFAVLMKVAAGPYWLASNIDPSYIYLTNALSMARGIAPAFTAHPGTPLVMLGAVIIKAFHLFDGNAAMIAAVIAAPEFYLNIMHAVLVLFYAGCLVVMGLYVYRKSGSKIAAFIVQLPAFLFLSLKSYPESFPLPLIANVNCEHLLLSVMCLLTIALVSLFYDKNEKTSWRMVFLLGVICGLGEAVKFSFTPVVIIPLLLIAGKRRKFVFCMTCVAAFLVFTMPIWPYYKGMFGWLLEVFRGVGYAGSGRAGLIDPTIFFQNLFGFIRDQWFCFIIAFGMFIMGFVPWVLRFGRKECPVCFKGYRFLTIISLSIFLVFLMVARQPAIQHLTSALALLGPLGLFGFLVFCMKDQKKKLWAGSLIILVAGVMIANSFYYQIKLRVITTSLLALDERINVQHKDCLMITSYRASGKDFAFYYGNRFINDPVLSDTLQKTYPDSYFLIDPINQITDYRRKTLRLAVISAGRNCVLFRTCNNDLSETPFGLQKIDEGGGENLYRSINSTEDEAIYAYLMSRSFFEKGDFRMAYVAALRSKAMKMQPPGFIDQHIEVLKQQLQNKKF